MNTRCCTGSATPGHQAGRQGAVDSSHCDPTVNLHDWIVAVRKGMVEALWPIDARGAVF